MTIHDHFGDRNTYRDRYHYRDRYRDTKCDSDGKLKIYPDKLP